MKNVYTDGSYYPKLVPPAGGVGVYFGQGDSRNMATGVYGPVSSDVAEMCAVKEALKIILLGKDNDFCINTDSLTTLKCIFQPTELQRKQFGHHITECNELYEKCLAAGKFVSFSKVKGHQNPGNIEADKLAKLGARIHYANRQMVNDITGGNEQEFGSEQEEPLSDEEAKVVQSELKELIAAQQKYKRVPWPEGSHRLHRLSRPRVIGKRGPGDRGFRGKGLAKQVLEPSQEDLSEEVSSPEVITLSHIDDPMLYTSESRRQENASRLNPLKQKRIMFDHAFFRKSFDKASRIRQRVQRKRSRRRTRKNAATTAAAAPASVPCEDHLEPGTASHDALHMRPELPEIIIID